MDPPSRHSSPDSSSAARSAVLDAELLKSIAARGGVRRYPANAVLINEGDRSDTLFLVLSGRVKVYAANEDGKEVTITTHGPGECVGELSLDGRERSASVITLEPSTCSVISGADLRDFIQAHPEFALYLIHKLIGRVRHATDRVKSLALDDVYVRITRLVNDLAIDGADGRKVSEKLTQQDIADRVGSSREMVSRVFTGLSRGGYVSVDRGWITLLKRLPAHW